MPFDVKHFVFNSTTLLKFLLTIILIPVGLLTKAYSGNGSEFVTNYLGGVIYVIFFIVLASLVFTKARPILISLIVFFITCLIEISQLIHTPLLEVFRKNLIFRTLVEIHLTLSIFFGILLVLYRVCYWSFLQPKSLTQSSKKRETLLMFVM